MVLLLEEGLGLWPVQLAIASRFTLYCIYVMAMVVKLLLLAEGGWLVLANWLGWRGSVPYGCRQTIHVLLVLEVAWRV